MGNFVFSPFRLFASLHFLAALCSLRFALCALRFYSPRYASITWGSWQSLRACLRPVSSRNAEHDPVGQSHDRLHHVLDHEDGDASFTERADELGHLPGFLGVQAGYDFIQEQDLGGGGQGPGDFQPFRSTKFRLLAFRSAFPSRPTRSKAAWTFSELLP